MQAAATSTWTIDPTHSEVSFTVRHMMVTNTRGLFSKFAGTVTLDEADVTRSTVNVEIEASSVTTRDEQRDTHLRSADFFDAAKFPKLTFQSTRVERRGDELNITGDLTIRGTTRSVVLKGSALSPAVKDPWGNMRRSIEANTKINRKDFGLVWNTALEAGGVLVSDEVSIHLEAQFIEKK